MIHEAVKAKHPEITIIGTTLIYFNNTRICPSINYHARQLLSLNVGDIYLPTTMSVASDAPLLAASCVRDAKSVTSS
jgi:hypothetical protein